MRKSTNRALDITLVGLALLPAFLAFPRTAPAQSVDGERLTEHVAFLAADELGGRGNGTAGLEKAAEYIADRFSELALLPAGDHGTYFQWVPVTMGAELLEPATLVLRNGESAQERVLRSPDDVQPLTSSRSGKLSARLVFVGYGITAPDVGYDDYAGIDVAGKIALMLRYSPRWRKGGLFRGKTYHATFARKVQNAHDHGAIGIVLVNGPLNTRSDRLVTFGTELGAETMPLPALHVRRSAVDEMLAAQGLSLRELQRSIDENMSPRSIELEGFHANIRVAITENVVEVPNVLGYLPPSSSPTSSVQSGDALVYEQYVVVGAHYDHVGLGESGSRDRRSRGKIHNGADDNASGVAGVIELARLMAEGERRERALLFAAFAGEELGLRGSIHYTRNATIPIERATAMVNLDMIGRLRHNRIFISGLEQVPAVSDVVTNLLRERRLSLSSRFSAEDASDHAAFARAGVPSLFFFTGLHGDYHKPTDDVQFLNVEGMTTVVDLSYRVVEHLVSVDSIPRMVAGAGNGGGPRWTGAENKPGYLGLGADREFPGEGMRFAYVADGGPAAEAGLRPGDVLVELDGQRVRSAEGASSLLRTLRPGDTVSGRVRREGELLEFTVRVRDWP